MRSIPIAVVHEPAILGAPAGPLARLGQAMRRHQRVIQALQWVVVGVYALLVTVPAAAAEVVPELLDELTGRVR